MTESRSASVNASRKTRAACGAGEGVKLRIGIGRIRDFGKERRWELGQAYGLLEISDRD